MILHELRGLAAQALNETMTPEQLRAAIAQARDPRSGDTPERISYTPHAQTVLELSLREARRIGQDYVGTEHILLGVLVEPEGVGGRVLRGLGIDHRGVDQWLRRWNP